MSMSKNEQIVGLQDLIDSLTQMKFNLQEQTGATRFSEVVTSYSSERSGNRSDVSTKQVGTKQQLREVRSRLDRLFSTAE